jgi:hypothetical protein
MEGSYILGRQLRRSQSNGKVVCFCFENVELFREIAVGSEMYAEDSACFARRKTPNEGSVGRFTLGYQREGRVLRLYWSEMRSVLLPVPGHCVPGAF